MVSFFPDVILEDFKVYLMALASHIQHVLEMKWLFYIKSILHFFKVK